MLTLKRTAIIAAILMLTVGKADAVTVGNDAIDRAISDAFSNFAALLLDHTFPEGTINEWEVFAANSGELGLLVLSDQGGSNYRIEGADVRTVAAGLNQFSGTSIEVESGEFLGIYMSDAKVDFDIEAGSNALFSNNGALSGGPSVGDIFFFQSFEEVFSPHRTYSINATVAAVPLPETLPIVVAVLLTGGLFRISRQPWRLSRPSATPRSRVLLQFA